jgi:ATP adenylyltransferase
MDGNMEKLWSPWRSQYIESFGGEKKEACIFCSAPAESADNNSLIVHLGNLTYTILNLYPYNNGHLMVVPYRHLASLNELSAAEQLEIMKKIRLGCDVLKMASNPAGYNIGANIGQVSGAGIADHIHFHIVPRWNGDTNFMPVLGEVKVLSQDLLDTKNKLTAAYDRLSNTD